MLGYKFKGFMQYFENCFSIKGCTFFDTACVVWAGDASQQTKQLLAGLSREVASLKQALEGSNQRIADLKNEYGESKRRMDDLEKDNGEWLKAQWLIHLSGWN